MTQNTLDKVETVGLKLLGLIDLYVDTLEKNEHLNVNTKLLQKLINTLSSPDGKGGKVSTTPDITRAYYQVSTILLKNQELKQKFGEVEEGELAALLTQKGVEKID